MEKILKKLEILAESAKYDASCSSSGSTRSNTPGGIGNAAKSGICHSFTPDGRCVSLLKVLLTNACMYDCSYCINRRSNDFRRAAFTPRELADLTIAFYRRNYIEGLFLSSAISRSPDYTMEQMYECLRILREEYNFNGYIHAKIIPGSSPELIDLVSMLADRVSVNLELPSEDSLTLLAPDKTKKHILSSMNKVTHGIETNKHEVAQYKHAPKFAPAGQSTQMIIGASPDTDLQIIKLTEGLYKKFQLKRVYYSAYIPVGTSELLPAKTTEVPLLREHRLYQADWLLRFYGFKSNEILDEKAPFLDPYLDPKANWAINHYDEFPIEINTADYWSLLRIPGVGVTSVHKIMTARKKTKLTFTDLKKMRIVLKRAAYFITCNGKAMDGVKFGRDFAYQNLVLETKFGKEKLPHRRQTEQLPLFKSPQDDFLTLQKKISIQKEKETRPTMLLPEQVPTLNQEVDHSGFLG